MICMTCVTCVKKMPRYLTLQGPWADSLSSLCKGFSRHKFWVFYLPGLQHNTVSG
jgi:hypothetical protein